jgi:Concanavalin A-like lectin/glucanases superfamily
MSASARSFRAWFTTGVIGAGFLVSGCAPPVGGAPGVTPSPVRGGATLENTEGNCAKPNLRQTLAVDAYDRQVLSFCPVMYLAMSHPDGGTEPDLSGHDHDGVYLPVGERPASWRLPNGDTVADFDGDKEYLRVASARELSVPNTGRLTVQAWIEAAVLQFRHQDGSGYVYILGKGSDGKQEYALRMYSLVNSEKPERPNRVSAYVFNLRGGKGSGAYFQDKIRPRKWMMVTFVVDDRSSNGWPDGYVTLYKNDSRRGKVSLSQFSVRPGMSDAPLYIGTRQLESFFQGAIGKVAVFDHVLSGRDISSIYNAMRTQ